MTRIWSGHEENSVHTERMRSQCIATGGDSSYCKRDSSEREFSADKKDKRVRGDYIAINMLRHALQKKI